LNNHFSERILLLRKKHNLSQLGLGEAVNLSKQTINDIEKGRSKTTLDKAILLANFFGVSLDYLTGQTDVPDISDKKLSISQEESELLEDFRLLNKYEQNVIIGKISELIYNKNIERENQEVSDEFLEIELNDRINR